MARKASLKLPGKHGVAYFVDGEFDMFSDFNSSLSAAKKIADEQPDNARAVTFSLHPPKPARKAKKARKAKAI